MTDAIDRQLYSAETIEQELNGFYWNTPRDFEIVELLEEFYRFELNFTLHTFTESHYM